MRHDKAQHSHRLSFGKPRNDPRCSIHDHGFSSLHKLGESDSLLRNSHRTVNTPGSGIAVSPKHNLRIENRDERGEIAFVRGGGKGIDDFPLSREVRIRHRRTLHTPASTCFRAANESGRYEVYVQPHPGPGGKWQISTEGGTEPLWNPNGRELFYRSGDKLMAAAITTQPRFSAGKPKVLFAGQFQPSASQVPNANYDVSPDGKRFLMIKPGGRDQAPTQIKVVLNWFQELKEKVPSGKK